MGIDAGFDMVPQLTKGAVDRHNWARFIGFLQEHYKDDDQIKTKPNYLLFKAGEHPKLPFEGQKFLRFSSKVSSRTATESRVKDYIKTVARIAQIHFGSRVRYWDESRDQWGHYSWTDVHEAIRSYEQPDEPEMPSSIASFVFGIDPLKELDVPLFEVRPIPGKGKGLVTRFNLAKGTRILVEKPLLTVQSTPVELLEKSLASKLKLLTKHQQRQFLSLHNNFPGKHPFSGIVKTNALPCGAGSDTGGVYPSICLINHSCLPNSHNNWNPENGHETIHAIRPINAGEEITISYDNGGPSKVRLAKLAEAFGFDCDCVVCSLHPTECHASDVRRSQIQSLDDAIGDPFQMMNDPNSSLKNCRSLLKLLNEEYHGNAGAFIPRLYYDAFQISIAHGDQARASVFAERAYKGRVVCEGEDSSLTKKTKCFMQNPASHSNFRGCSTRWVTRKESVPEGLNTDEFENWLWRQNQESQFESAG